MRVALLKWLILRWLDEGPKTGYELLRLYKNVAGRTSPGSVYPALSQLAAKGLVRKEENKYVLTEEGKRVLRELMKEKEKHMREARAVILAFAKLFDDPSLTELAQTLGAWERLPPPLLESLLDLRSEVLRLGMDALPVLKRAVEELRRINRGSSRT